MCQLNHVKYGDFFYSCIYFPFCWLKLNILYSIWYNLPGLNISRWPNVAEFIDDDSILWILEDSNAVGCCIEGHVSKVSVGQNHLPTWALCLVQLTLDVGAHRAGKSSPISIQWIQGHCLVHDSLDLCVYLLWHPGRQWGHCSPHYFLSEANFRSDSLTFQCLVAVLRNWDWF